MLSTTLLLVMAGAVTLTVTVVLVSSLALRRLRTVPEPPVISSSNSFVLPSEVQAGLKLHRACFDNDADAANNALIMWAWATGEAAVANSLDRKIEALREPDLQDAIKRLWRHLEAPKERPWFGDELWSAFCSSHPQFQELELSG